LIKKLESSNWHEREETLNIFIYSLVAKNVTIYYEFADLIRPVSKLLHDNRSKLRFVALETIAVFAEYCGKD